MSRLRVIFGLLLSLTIPIATVESHDAITTSITWNREVSRIVYDRCAACHREGGAAFSLMTYADARPWAVAIKEETLTRRMPPWGAIRGFQDLRNDQSLTAEELEMISSWVEGGVPEGDPKDLPPEAPAAPVWTPPSAVGTTITGQATLKERLKLDGLAPVNIPPGASFQLVAETPQGVMIPLLWIYEYQPQFPHAFLFQTPVELPANTKLHGLPPDVRIVLLPAR